MKLFVITERGRVVGTQPVTPLGANAPASVALRAGPGQNIHEIEVAVSGDLATAKEIEAFHRVVAAALRPPPRKRRAPAARRGRRRGA
jgi:hypothetical protein